MMQYLDFSPAASSTSKKWPHKRQPGQGFDAPRNSMEFAMDAPPRSYGVFQEDVPYTRNNMRQYPRASSAPVKKLIHEDISSMRPNEGHKRAPSVIARLMGMDSPPLSSATGQLIAVAHSDDRRRQEMIIARPVTRRDPAEMISTKHVSFVEHKNPPARQATKHEIRPFDDDDESKRSNGGGDDDRWSKPVPREHPQEEELQKFKKEFEAWQTSRVWEQSRTLELETRHGAVVLDDNDDDRRCSEIVPYRYHHQQQQKQGYRGRDTGGNDNGDGEVHWRRRRNKDGGASISGSRTFSVASSAGDDYSSRLPLSRFYREEEEEQRSSPTRIVVLRPCPELSADDVSELSLVGSPQLMKKENDMEAFLEEVKTRLKLELEGSNHRASDAWAGDMADPKRIARSIASQIRDTVVAMDAHHQHPALVRSESTRSYRSSSDVQSQVDYICRDARRQLSDRLRNVLRSTRESPEIATPEQPLFFPHRRQPSLDEAPPLRKPKPKPSPPRREAASSSGGKKKIKSKEEKKRAIESSDARHGLQQHSSYRTSSAAVDDSEDEDAAALSPRNLMRSFSAPVSSRTSNNTFVKLLSDEPRVLFPGARVQRKHEAGHGSRPLPASEEEDRPVKALGGIKGRVSSLRQNLGLRGKLFGKKLVHSSAADESSSSSFFPDDLPPIGTLITAPSVLIHPGVLQENSTEVPPSPASWCSSPADDMVRGGYPSPVSPLEASFGEHRSPLKPLPPATSSPASEQGIPWLEEDDQTQEVAETSPALHDAANEDDTAEIEMDHHPVKAFIRAVLVTAGMFGGQNTDQMFFSNSQPKPIPKWVLDEVVSSSSSSSPPAVPDVVVDRRLLFDLVNEHLPEATSTRGSTTLYTFSKWYIAAAPRRRGGKRLLDALWRAVQALVEPPLPLRHDGDALPTTTTTMMSSVDALIGRDMGASPWSGGAFRGDVDGVGEEVEAEILGELLDETLWDVLLNVGED